MVLYRKHEKRLEENQQHSSMGSHVSGEAEVVYIYWGGELLRVR